MQRFILILVCLAGINIQAQDVASYLLPHPQQLIINEGNLSNLNSKVILPEAMPELDLAIMQVCREFEASSYKYDLSPVHYTYETPLLNVTLDKRLESQSYLLKIKPEGIELKGGDKAGLFYGLQTLCQIGKFAKDQKHWPCLAIKDKPDFKRRGIMLDISRDKVPTMSTLFGMIDQFASWKINELQLYTEHTFAYKNHQTVWRDASPMTAEEIRILDVYCKERFIDLVPNQNSFGHMKRWLIHDEYKHLAELPKPGKTIWGMRSLNSLNPTDPGSLELMKELYTELLPNFSSQYFNIGCDETVELGVGKSKALCKSQGKGRVYLDFVRKLKKEVDSHGRITQFWGDIILHYPKLIPELPKDMVALIWGYNANHPFDKQCALFKDAGLKYYVCPGTSTWNSILGRNKNAFANLRNAAVNGKKHDATGFLNTNWGDQGHWQPLSVCYPAFIYGAALGWQVEANKNMNIARQTAWHVFNDKSGASGEAIVNLGNAYLSTKVMTDNSNIFHQTLKRNRYSIKTDRWLKSIRAVNMEQCIKHIETELDKLNNSSMQHANADLIRKEMTQACDLCIHACKLAIAKTKTSTGLFKDIDDATKQELSKQLTELIANHQELWELRNRIGGLKDSTEKMENVLKTYR